MGREFQIFRTRERGAVAVAFILFSILLLGFVAFALDVGRLYVSKAELQNAADSCALSAAGALTGADSNQLQVAEDYGIATGTRNLIGMQKHPVQIAPDSDITFSETINGTYLTKSAAAANALKMRFARCNVSEPDVKPLMITVLNLLPGNNIGASTVHATAVATLAPSSHHFCAVPLALCTESNPTSGDWLVGRFNTKDNINGKFKWVDFPGFEKTKDLKALLNGNGGCSIDNTTTLTPTQGDVNSLAASWNWRFGVAKNSGPPADAMSPDWSGYAYDYSNWPAGRNAFDDFKTRRGNHDPWNDVPKLSGGWKASDIEVHVKGSDRRMVALPMVSCAAWNAGGKNSQNIDKWACALLLNPVANPSNDNMMIEYRGLATDPGAGCMTSGAPGENGATGPLVPTLVQ